MRTQRRIIYFTVAISFISIVVYYICVFVWAPATGLSCRWNTFLSNTMLALFGSALLSAIVSYLSYCDCRQKSLEQYIKAHRAIFRLSGQYGKTDYAEWFENYCRLCEELSDAWAEIWFLIDPKRHRVYLKNISDFYEDLIVMTQESFRILKQGVELRDVVRKQVISDIDKIIFCEEEINHGKLIIKNRNNRLTSNKELVFKNIDEIYRNRKLTREYSFTDTLVTNDVFVVLTAEQEKYVDKICHEIDRTNSCRINMRIPENIAQALLNAGYISGIHSDETGICGLDCNFILDHYFWLKGRIASKRE